MFNPILDTILAQLALNLAFKTVDVWQGDVKDLLDTVQKTPSAHVLLSGGDFDEATTIGGTSTPYELTWSVVILTENRRDRAAAARDTLTLLQDIINPAVPEAGSGLTPGLTRLNTGYGLLWPATLQFLGTEQGKTAYGFKFTMEKGRNNR
jgi:hypothetical protein